MSMTFRANGEGAEMNLSNVNACDLLRWLAYDPVPEGADLTARDLAARCRRRLWPEARNFDPAVGAITTRSVTGARLVECGRREGYLRERTEQLLRLADAAGDGVVSYY
jgi:hypothetical protein